MPVKKNYSRFQTILASALFRLLISFGNLLISLFIIRLYSAELWGEIVYYILLLDLGFVIINWGHSFYLSRQFALHPKLITAQFQHAITSRMYLMIVFTGIILFIPADNSAKLFLVVWSVMRFLYQAFDPLIQYHRKFLLALFVEITGVIIIVLPLVLQSTTVNVTTVIELFALSFLCRGVIFMIVFRHSLSGIKFIDNPIKFFKPALPFLLLTLMALLQQRMDLYLVALYLAPEQTAAYQVFLNLLLLSHVAASLLLSPYARNIYRLPHGGLRKIERQFIGAGVLLSAVSLGVIYMIMEWLFQFQLSLFMYVAGYFYVLLYYFYQVRNYQFMKDQRQIDVAFFSLAGCAVSLVLGLILIPIYNMEGAIVAGLSTQLLNAILHLRVRFRDHKVVSSPIS